MFMLMIIIHSSINKENIYIDKLRLQIIKYLTGKGASMRYQYRHGKENIYIDKLRWAIINYLTGKGTLIRVGL